MQYRRCQCGNAERWDTGEVVHPCEGCRECNTTFAQSPSGHEPISDHDWVVRYSESTGKPKHKMCSRCHHWEPLDPD